MKPLYSVLISNPRWRRTKLNQLLVLLSLTGFAITEPVLAIFGANPDVFHFHNIDTPLLISLYAFIVAFTPALLLWSVTVIAGLIHTTIAKILHLLFVFILSALWLVQLSKWHVGIEQPSLLAIISAFGAVAFVLAYLSWKFINSWLQIAAIAPVIALGVFLQSSDIGRAARYVAPGASHATSTKQLPNVLFVLLDEFPTMALLDKEGLIDNAWFPNLAELSDQSTWYRHYSALSDQTKFSVPSILTGGIPRTLTATMVNFPENLFTLLAPTHHLTVFEQVTKLCSLPECGEGPPGASIEHPATLLGALLSKTITLWLRRVSLSSYEGASLDDFQEQITSNRNTASKEPASEEGKFPLRDLLDPTKQFGLAKAQPERLTRFIQTFSQDEHSALYFIHLEMPHTPWRFYGNGQMYEVPIAREPLSVDNKDGGEWLAKLSEYRFFMQTQYTDLLLGDIFSRLKLLGIWDEMLVIVTADHGRSFRFNTDARRANSLTFDGIAYAPLFIKQPFQKRGYADDSNLMSYDLLPTIADILEIDVPWRVWGLPVNNTKTAERGDRKEYFATIGKNWFGGVVGEKETFSDVAHFPKYSSRAIGTLKEANKSIDLLNDSLGLQRFFGRSPEEFEVQRGGSTKIYELVNLKNPSPDRAPLGIVMGNLEFEPHGDYVLIAINGHFVTGSPLVNFRQVKHTFIAMLPSGVLTKQNDVGVYLVDDNRLMELEIH